MAARGARVQFDQDRVLHEIALLASSDIMNYVVDDEGNVGLRAGAHPDATRAIASLKKKILHTDAGTLYETEIRLWNKPASVRMAAEHLGLLLPAQTAGTTTVNVLVHYAPTPPQEVSPPPPAEGLAIAPHVEYTPASQET